MSKCNFVFSEDTTVPAAAFADIVRHWNSFLSLPDSEENNKSQIAIAEEELVELISALKPRPLTKEDLPEIIDGCMDVLWTQANLANLKLITYAEYLAHWNAIAEIHHLYSANSIEHDLSIIINNNYSKFVELNSAPDSGMPSHIRAAIRTSIELAETLEKYRKLLLNVSWISGTVRVLSFFCFTEPTIFYPVGIPDPQNLAVVFSADNQRDKHGKFYPKGKILKSINWREPEWNITSESLIPTLATVPPILTAKLRGF